MISESNIKQISRDKRPLQEVIEAFPSLMFSNPQEDVRDKNKLEIIAQLENTKIRVFMNVRTKNIQIELRGGGNWIHQHFQKLGCENLVRPGNEPVFLPNPWKGAKNIASNSSIAIKRIKLLLEVVYADSIGELGEEARKLLE